MGEANFYYFTCLKKIIYIYFINHDMTCFHVKTLY